MAFDATTDFITREERYLAYMAGAEITYPEPITREEKWLASMCDPQNNTPPDPITRKEQFLSAIQAKIAEGGGGLGELIVEDEVEVSTTSTTATNVKIIDLPADTDYSGKILFVKIRDKAGVRDGYFYGSNTYCGDAYSRLIFKGSSDTAYVSAVNAWGIYVSALIKQENTLTLTSKYSANSSGTIDGTFSIEVYSQDI